MTAELTAAAAQPAEGDGPKPDDLDLDDLVAGLRPRLAGLVADGEVDRLVRDEVAGLGPVRVTTYLPILVERRVRARVRAANLDNGHEVRVTA